MNNKFSLRQFRRKYGTHEQCLEAIKRICYPDEMNCDKCKKLSIFYPIKGRTAYTCKYCGYQIYPLAGTIFEKSTTPLDLWFFAMYLMVQTRSGISAKQLERMLGVTYKTAWRMFRQIRILMAEMGDDMLTEIVEIDETFVGGKGKNRAHKWIQGVEEKQKEVLMGIVERNGKAYIRHIPTTGKWALIEQIQKYVSPKARVITDEFLGYASIYKYGYKHDSVNHRSQQYVLGDIHTQTIESFWSGLKRGIYGVYRVVSKKYLQAYADEYAWRYNNRKACGGMFNILLKQVVNVRAIQPSLIK